MDVRHTGASKVNDMCSGQCVNFGYNLFEWDEKELTVVGEEGDEKDIEDDDSLVLRAGENDGAIGMKSFSEFGEDGCEDGGCGDFPTHKNTQVSGFFG